MNKARVLNTAKDFLSEISEVNENLYKGNLLLEANKLAGVFYLDFSDNFANTNITDYQESIFSKDYYAYPGNLQWNYYLILFTDKIELKKKQEIEENDKYARKYVFNEIEFENFFKINTADKVLQTDIIIEWKKMLDSVDLHELYSNIPAATAIKRFNNNTTIKIKEKKNNNNSHVPISRIDFLNKIELTPKYRPIPQKRIFDFKKVNLIEGVNGVGKTSLFEAIELVLCGRCLRNPEKIEEEKSIISICNNTQELIYSQNNDIYRQRDKDWYGNVYNTRNYLAQSFNRYNFFNSDAAYSFSNSSQEESIKNSLLNLSLGSEYNYILERANKFFISIRADYNRLNNEVLSSKQITKEYKELVDKRPKAGNISFLEHTIEGNIQELKIKKAIKQINRYSELEELINEANSLINIIQKNTLRINSFEELENQRNFHNDRKTKFEDFQNSFNTILTKLDDLEGELRNDYNTLSLLNESMKYFSDIRFFNILELNKEYEKMNQLASQIIRSKESLDSVNIDTFKINKSALDYINSKKEELYTLNNHHKNAENELNQKLNQFDILEKTINEIKFLGKQVIDLNNSYSDCPLCQAKYTVEELRIRIEEIPDQSSSKVEGVQKLFEKEKILKDSINEIENNINTINKILREYTFFLNEPTDSNLDELSNIINYLEAKFESLQQLKISISEFKSFENIMSDAGVSHTNFLHYHEKILEVFGSTLEFSYENKDKFEQTRDNLVKSIEVKKNTIDTTIKEKESMLEQLRKGLELPSISEPEINSIKNSIESNESNLQTIIMCFEKLQAIFDLNEIERIDSLQLTLTILGNNIILLKQELKNQADIDFSKKQNDEAESFINENKILFDRLKNAKNALETILENDADKQLEVFFNKNLEEICDIFMTIHVPKEFDNIIFDKELYLIDNKGEGRKVTQISAGQRSALALSIFITLNRKLKNGPNIIMFDDPITYVDDFNVLSFIDFLRLFIMKERQIFFATANKKLGSLFKNKFNFLGKEDFKVYPLNREL